MKIGPFVLGKDGGKDSTVDGVMFEIKSLFSVGVLRFQNGSREAFHSHAFNCWSVLLRGVLEEESLGGEYAFHTDGARITTKRSDVHKVRSFDTSYVLTFRGPWADCWLDVEQRPDGWGWGVSQLTNGRCTEVARFFNTREQANDFAKRFYDV